MDCSMSLGKAREFLINLLRCGDPGPDILDHCSPATKDAYQSISHPHFGKSDHNVVLLLPAYKQKLKCDDPVQKVMHCWSDATEGLLRKCFESVDLSIFKNLAASLNKYATTVTDFIRVLADIFNFSFLQSEVPTCFRKATTVLVPKKNHAVCLNDYRPVALTSIIIKCFESKTIELAVQETAETIVLANQYSILEIDEVNGFSESSLWNHRQLSCLGEMEEKWKSNIYRDSRVRTLDRHFRNSKQTGSGQ
eukprot:g37177.t1